MSVILLTISALANADVKRSASENSGGGLSTAAITGIIVGCLFAVISVTVITLYYFKSPTSSRTSNSANIPMVSIQVYTADVV